MMMFDVRSEVDLKCKGSTVYYTGSTPGVANLRSESQAKRSATKLRI